ncbi:MAG: ParB N-terminal domain-containing protein [Rhizorhabdus sp.]|uniref:DUF6551 family protein n=1 Tax=Rhizorhabdus sp. TaxID=1968843 RepID=UPI001B44BE2E|nr:DUF6551 family protein [Rhizorhabdus sp.]MBP8233117.1 ParB N-terminal domain-containing protein [Rhizorhabdus sp.]
MSRPATSRVKVNAPLGMRPSLENRKLSELNIDPSYQRSIDNSTSQTLIRKIAQFWDWGLFQPLVVARRADGTFWVVDGQHRLAAARLRNDMWDLPCVITQHFSPGDEAAAFVALNVQRKPLSRMDLFRAALSAGDDTAVEIQHLIDKAGLSLATHSNPTAWKPGQLYNIGGIIKAHKVHGVKVTGMALRTLAKAFAGDVLQYAGTLFGGIVETIASEMKSAPDDYSPALFELVLQGATQAEWVAEIHKARGANPLLKWDVAAHQVFERAYSEACGEE